MAVAGCDDLGDELAHPASGQAEPLGYGPLAQRLPGRDRRRVRCPDRLLYIARHLWRVWRAGRRALPARAATSCMAISTAPMNATAGQTEISAP